MVKLLNGLVAVFFRASGPILPVMYESVLIRILQMQIAVVLGLEVYYQAVVVIVFDNIRHIDELSQRSAGNRVGCFNAIHLTPPFPYKRGTYIDFLG